MVVENLRYMLDDRAKLLLKTLIDRYISDGNPVGSRTLSETEGIALSPATIRNIMSDLEALGLIHSPHTSAGRIPTPQGYRIFVDTLLTSEDLHAATPDSTSLSGIVARQPARILTQAADMLSSLSHFVGVVRAPRKSIKLQHLEFLRLSEKRVLLILVSMDGDVQNRVLFPPVDYEQQQLQQAADHINTQYAGMELQQVCTRLSTDIDRLRTEVALLMQAVVDAGDQAVQESETTVVVSGERNLLSIDDFASNLEQLRAAFDLFEQKTQLLHLLDASHKADGIQIYIGGESPHTPGEDFSEDFSIVSAPYQIDGTIVGRLAVVGPTRMRYDRMIQIVDITARLAGSALSQGTPEA